MALDLHISGPGLEVHRRLQAGEPPLVLGRDTECAVCLADPERNISRRHLSVWNEGEQLHFHVLSVVNGVDLASGELPPGSRGVLAPGEVMILSAYRLRAMPAVAAAAGGGQQADPWTEFERHAARMVPEAGSETVPAVGDADDPFGDWGFHTTFGPGSPGGGLQAEDLLPAQDLHPFFRGVGVQGPDSFTQGELETLGRLVRFAVLGVLHAVQAAGAVRQELRLEDRTAAAPSELNPLRQDTSLQVKLDYLFGGQSAADGLLPPDRALVQLTAELEAHQQAMGEAVPEAVRAILQEFEPDALKKRLLTGGSRIFESARAWDAFVRDHAERQSGGDEWLRQLLARHFDRVYARALLRAKRNTTSPKEG